MKVSIDRNKIIIELEQEDIDTLPPEVAADAFFMGIKRMLERPELLQKTATTLASLVNGAFADGQMLDNDWLEELNDLTNELRQKWELP